MVSWSCHDNLRVACWWLCVCTNSYINARAGKLRQSTSSRFRVLDTDLQGLDSLWAILLHAPRATALAALKFLVPVYVRTARRDAKLACWDVFVDKCMSLIAAAADRLGITAFDTALDLDLDEGDGEGEGEGEGEGVTTEAPATAASGGAGAAGAGAGQRTVTRDGDSGGGGGVLTVSSATAAAHDKNTLEVVLVALVTFLKQVEASGPRSGGVEGVKPRPLQLRLSREGSAEVTSFPYRGANVLPIGNIRATIASSMKVDPRCVQIQTHSGEVLRSDVDRLSAYELRAQRLLYVTVMRRPDRDGGEPISLEELEEERRHPRDRLSNNDEYFELLFQLLSVDNDQLVREVWALIQDLPTNDAIRRSIKTFGGLLPGSPLRKRRMPGTTTAPTVIPAASGDPGAPLETRPGASSASASVSASASASASSSAAVGTATGAAPRTPERRIRRSTSCGSASSAAGGGGVDWDRLLDSRAVLKLLYSLEIVHHLAIPEHGQSQSQEEATVAWCAKFVSLGGFSHLYNVLMRADLAPLLADALSTSCLELLLRLVHFFMVGPRDRLTPSRGVDFAALVPRLLEVVVATTHADAADGEGAGATGAGGRTTGGAGADAAARDGEGRTSATRASGARDAVITVPARIVRSCLALIHSMVKQRPSLFHLVANFPDLPHTLVHTLLRVPDRTTRQEVQRGILLLCRDFPGYLDVPGTAATASGSSSGGSGGNMDALRLGGLGAGEEASSSVSVDAARALPPNVFFLTALANDVEQVYQHETTCSQFFDTLAYLVRVPRTSDVAAAAAASASSNDMSSSVTAGAGSAHAVAPPPVPLPPAPSTSTDGTPATAPPPPPLPPPLPPTLPRAAPPLGRQASTMSVTSVASVSATRDVADAYDLGAFVDRLTHLLRAHAVRERTSADLDRVLVGTLRLLSSTLHRRPGLKHGLLASGLVRELFSSCLFASPDPDARGHASPPKCKSRAARKAALALLAEVSFGCADTTAAVLALVAPHHEALPRRLTARSTVDLGTHGRSATGFCGLRNPGMICYMISSMQQFFNIPAFRRDVLAYAEPEDAEAPSVVHHMQRMFAHLQESERRYYKPDTFALSVKDMGEPTNLMIQKDASEFLTNLFQQMEETLSGTRHEKMVKNYFGGTLSAELLAEGHYSERKEDFYYLSVPVKNKANLHESLLAFIAGETVDYKWEEPDGSKKQLDTTKRTSVDQLPPTLIIHLKRFEFDFDLMQQVKVNSHFAFPLELDMYPYSATGRADAVTKQNTTTTTTGDGAAAAAGNDDDDGGGGGGGGGGGDEGGDSSGDPTHASSAVVGAMGGGGEEQRSRGMGGVAAAEGVEESKAGGAGGADTVPPHDPAYYKYELMGIVVHTGTMEMGHYYSYIRERDAFARSDGAEVDVRRWMEFNDDAVTPWDAEDMELDTFGGSATNAFLLVYDRIGSTVACNPSVASGAVFKGGAKVKGASPAALLSPQERQRRAMQANRAMIPPPLFKEIWNDNLEFRHRQHIFHADYFNFVYALVTGNRVRAVDAMPPDDADDTLKLETLGGVGVGYIRLGLSFVLNTLAQAADKSSLGTWMQCLRQMFTANRPACVWLLQTCMAHPLLLKRGVLSNVSSVRLAVCSLLVHVISVLAPQQRGAYLDVVASGAAATLAPPEDGDGDGDGSCGGGGGGGVDAGVGVGVGEEEEGAGVDAAGGSADGGVGTGDGAEAGTGAVGDGEKEEGGSKASSQAKKQPKTPALFAPPDAPFKCRCPNSRVVPHFIVFLLRMLPNLRSFAPASKGYFQVLCDFAALGVEESEFLRHQQAITSLVDFALGPYSPLVAPNEDGTDDHQAERDARARAMLRAGSRVSLSGLFRLVTLLSSACRPPTNNPELATVPPHQIVSVLQCELTAPDTLLLTCVPFLRKVVEQLSAASQVAVVKVRDGLHRACCVCVRTRVRVCAYACVCVCVCACVGLVLACDAVRFRCNGGSLAVLCVPPVSICPRRAAAVDVSRLGEPVRVGSLCEGHRRRCGGGRDTSEALLPRHRTSLLRSGLLAGGTH